MTQAFKTFLMTLVASTMFLSSCNTVREDLSDCPPPTPTPPVEVETLKVSFGSAGLDVKPTADELKNAVVYVFDSTGNLYATWTMSNPSLDTSYDTGIRLGSDTYRIVTWINPDAPYSVSPAGTAAPGSSGSALSDGRLALSVPASGTVTDLLPMLLYGSVTSVTTASTAGGATVAVPLVLDTYRINVTLSDLPQDGSTYVLRVTDSNGTYDFNNNFVDSPAFAYERSQTAGTGGGTGSLTLSLSTLRLDPSRSPMISVVNATTGATVFPQNGNPSVNLMDLVRQTNIDTTTTHTININVPFTVIDSAGTSANTSQTITINGWTVVLDRYDAI